MEMEPACIIILSHHDRETDRDNRELGVFKENGLSLALSFALSEFKLVAHLDFVMIGIKIILALFLPVHFIG